MHKNARSVLLLFLGLASVFVVLGCGGPPRIDPVTGDRLPDIGTAAAKDEPLPVATLKTTVGDIVVELLEDDAPHTVANFITLAEKGTFDNTPFSVPRGKPDPDADVSVNRHANVKYRIEGEPNAHKNEPGLVCMANAGAGSLLGGMFYIIRKKRATPAPGETAFGRVIGGMRVVRILKKGDRVLSVTIARKRGHAYKVYPLE